MVAADLHGTLVSISEQTMGDTLTASFAIGATTLSVVDAADFDEGGGSVLIGGNVYTYDSADLDLDTIHLTSGLTVSASLGDAVSVWDPDGAVVVTERVALVQADDQEDGDPLTVDIDHSLASVLAQTTFSLGQSVSLVADGDGYRLAAIHGKNSQVLTRSNANGVQLGIDQGGGTNTGLSVSTTTGNTYVLAPNTVQAKTADLSTFIEIKASAFTVSSDAALKTKPTAAPDALEIIKAAPASHWRYKTDPKGVKRLGPMAGDLPDWLAQEDPDDGTLGIDLARQSGLHHRAIEQLLARVEALESELTELKKER